MYHSAFPEQSPYGTWLERPEHRGIYHDQAAEKAIFGDEGLSFDSLLDAINPLHHIPIVNTIYREVTGDTIAPGPSLVGGFLFGGAIGAVGAILTAAFESATGDSLTGHAMTALDSQSDPETQLAAADTRVSVGEIRLAGEGTATNAEQVGPDAAAAGPTGSAPGSNAHRSTQGTAAEGTSVASPLADPPQTDVAGLFVHADDMPQLLPDLDARLRHAQKALAASGLVAAGDPAVQARIGAVLGESALPDVTATQPATARNTAVVPPPLSAQQEITAIPQPDRAPNPVATAAAPAAAAAVADAGRRYMALDTGGQGRRWFGLGTANMVPAAAPQTPQMAAQALANQVYRDRNQALQGTASKVDISY